VHGLTDCASVGTGYKYIILIAANNTGFPAQRLHGLGDCDPVVASHKYTILITANNTGFPAQRMHGLGDILLIANLIKWLFGIYGLTFTG